MSLTAERNTLQLSPSPRCPADLNFPLAASAKIYNGSIVALDASGNAVVPTGILGLTAVGRALSTVDNTGGAAGALRIDVKQGVFWYANSANADLITAASIGQTCYMVDGQTVALTNNGNARSPAGTVYGVDSAKGVAVQLGLPGAVAGSGFTMVLATPIPAYSAIADGDVLVRFTPGFAGHVLRTALQATTLVSTGSKATTLTPNIAGVAVTGGVVSATSAGQNARGASQAGSAVTALNSFGASDELTVVASATTTFTQGAGVFYLTLGS